MGMLNVKKRVSASNLQQGVKQISLNKRPLYSGIPPIGVFHLHMVLWPTEGVDTYKFKNSSRWHNFWLTVFIKAE